MTAIRTLTILPSPGADAVKLSDALPWFPIVGLALGMLLYAGIRMLDFMAGDRWPEGIAAATIVAGTILTGGLHLDGLADWADSLGGGGNRQRMLDIMKDSRTGAFGVIAVVSVILLKWIALSRLISLHLAIWMVAAYVVSRCMQADLAGRLPYARIDGTAAPFIHPAGMARRAVILGSGLSIMLLLCGFAGGAIFLVGGLAAWLFGRWCLLRLAGVTGDLLGACSEWTEVLTLFLCAFAGEKIIPWSRSLWSLP
ncbi:MAG: adenosylcobinamide-GDP ribazoletransferase [Nitrospirae bacterium]|nr:adenosylcobinamide-GDP ribazoletransferase [Nitrospirota bacterium]